MSARSPRARWWPKARDCSADVAGQIQDTSRRSRLRLRIWSRFGRNPVRGVAQPGTQLELFKEICLIASLRTAFAAMSVAAHGPDSPRHRCPVKRAARCRDRAILSIPSFSGGRYPGRRPAARNEVGSLERDLLSGSLRLLQCAPLARRGAKYRRRFFLWVVVGLSHRPARKRRGSRDIFFHKPLDWTAVVEEEIASKCDVGRFGTRSREGGLENHFTQPAPSTVSNESVELPLRPHADSI